MCSEFDFNLWKFNSDFLLSQISINPHLISRGNEIIHQATYILKYDTKSGQVWSEPYFSLETL